MNLSLQNFSTLVENASATAKSACSSLLDFSTGSVLRSLYEGNATVALWLQYLLLQVLSVTRLSTSFGTDVDSWISQFGISRLGATYATTTETFISLSPDSTSAVVPVGAVVKTADGTVSFSVTEDTTNQYWSTTAGGYVRPQGTTSITCPVVCTVAGSVGNVSAGSVNLLGTQIAGIDTCTNLAAAANGADQESGTAVKNRVALWFASLASATLTAIEAAISGVASNLSYQVVENQTVEGLYRSGFFYAVIDDGSGNTPQSLLESVETAIEATRACGVETSTIRATVIPVTITLSVSLATGVALATVQNAIVNEITNYVDALAVGELCQYTRVSSIAVQAAGSLVSSVGVLTINGQTSDVGGSTATVVRVEAVNVTQATS
ncbi:baseplate J/gp47 family protein [Acetobacter estunensis]|uniref:baseplate J/gp47 family protein n=1 Tax=Acetobacter estunensis TaxID=104097 RepID=UPI001C2D560A|nr:baseplate J/gp47 family protein [Acetobacter estunensis]MBV1838617.1 baseplate J/gp47 family protein [Acetobacter estunensis]